MSRIQQARQQSRISRLVVSCSVLLLAPSMGAGAGALVAWLSPSEELGWAGLLALPAWLALEVFLSSLAEAFGGYSKAMRFWAALAVLAGFYGVWLTLRV